MRRVVRDLKRRRRVNLRGLIRQLTDPTTGVVPRLDWRAYFERFCSIHGLHPVVWAGKLLFPDGWQYSLTSYAGPEFPPESPERAKALSRIYWRRRLSIVKREYNLLRGRYMALKALQATKSAPLQQRTRWPGSADGTTQSPDGRTAGWGTVENVDWLAIEQRLEWLKADIEHCQNQLQELADD